VLTRRRRQGAWQRHGSLKETEGVPASSAARQYLMPGECYYLLEQVNASHTQMKISPFLATIR
jgi:hypothetical protein